MKKGILFFVFVSLALQLVSFASAGELTDDYFDIATNYFNSNNFAKSLEYLDLIMQIEPENLAAKTLRDKISPPAVDVSKQTVEAEQTEPALKVVKSPENLVVLNVPQADTEKMAYNSDYYNKKGQEFYSQKDYNTAIEYFYKSIKLNKHNAQAYNNLAMSYWLKNNTQVAIKYFRKAYSLNRNYTQPLVNLSNLYRQLGNSKVQVYYLKKAIKSNYNDYLAYYWLGNYYRSIGDYPDSIAYYKEVVKINPKFSQVYICLAMSFFETEDFNYTIMALSQYGEFYPDSDFAYYLSAKANLAMCHYVEAKTYIEKAIATNNNSEYQFELAKIDYAIEDYNSALDIFQKLVQANESAELFNYIGLSNYKLKNIDLAIANFNKAIQLDSMRPIYYYNLAQCYKSLGDKPNYSKNVNTATKINPINYQDFIDLSYIYYDNGNPSYAINTLNHAISKYPGVKSLYLSKLKIYEALNDNLHYNETKDLIDMRFNR